MLKNKLILMIGLTLLLGNTIAFSAEEQRSTSNLGYVFGAKDAAKPKHSDQPALIPFGPRATGKQAKSATAKNGCFNCSHPDFRIFDSRVSIWGDDDADGFYRGLSVTFDVDNYGPGEWVYARLFISLEGGPWNEYAVTDDFYIEGLAADDNYSIDTDLLTGYPTGFYDVLIEVYAARDGEFLTLSGPDEDLDLFALALEDSERDIYDPYVDNYYHAHGGHGGSLSLFLMGLVILSLGRFRGLESISLN